MSLDPAVAAVRLGVRRVLTRADTGGSGEPVVVACSGGADSLALLAAAVFEARPLSRHVVAATVDHGLQEGSEAHTRRVVEQMAALGADETVSARVRVEARGQGPEAAAREARYAVLHEVAERFGAPLVLLGHTRDDQAETVLLGLTRGSGTRALAGMRPGFDVFARPLLDVTRAQTEAACTAEDITWWRDPHNEDPRYTRARVRHTVLPLLEEQLGPGVAATLARTADQLREDAEALDAWAERASASGVPPVPELRRLPTAVRLRVLRGAALAAGSPASETFRVHVLALDDLVTGTVGGRRVQLPGHVTAYTEADTLRFAPTAVSG